MCNVNYVSEFNAMMRYAAQNGLTGRERLLWIALFYAANDRSVYNVHTGERDWPQGFFGVAHSELNLLSTLNKKGVEEIRNILKQRGLIDFKNGSRNKAAPMYKLNYLTVGVEKDPNMISSNAPNNTPKEHPNNSPNAGTRNGSLYLNKRENETGDQRGYSEEEEETDNLSTKTRAREIAKYWKSCFGTEPTTAVVNYLTGFQDDHDFDNEIIEAVINRAALVNPANVFDYISTLLFDLSAKDVRKITDLGSNFVEYKIAKMREQRRNKDEQYYSGGQLNSGS